MNVLFVLTMLIGNGFALSQTGDQLFGGDGINNLYGGSGNNAEPLAMQTLQLIMAATAPAWGWLSISSSFIKRY